MPIKWEPEDLLLECWEDLEKIERLAQPARAALSALTDAMEDELVNAVEQQDVRRIAQIAWLYGDLTNAIVMIEAHLTSPR